jgi:hypothetical protein
MPPREHYGLAALSTSGGQLTMSSLGAGCVLGTALWTQQRRRDCCVNDGSERRRASSGSVQVWRRTSEAGSLIAGSWSRHVATGSISSVQAGCWPA